MPDNRIVVRNVPDQRIPVKNDVPVYLNSTIVKKIITSNGTYRAAEEKANGYDPVVVDVPTYEAENAQLTAEVAELTETVAAKTAEITQLEAEVGEAFDRGYAEGDTEGYEKGKTDGVAEGYEQGKVDGNTLRYATKLSSLFRDAVFPDGYETVVDVPNISDANIGYMFYEAKGTRKVTINIPVETPYSGNYVFYNASVEEIVLPDGMKFKETNQFARGAETLKRIVGRINLSGASQIQFLVYGCKALEDISFVPNTIESAITFAQSPNLSDDAIQFIIDGLADLIGKTAQTLTFHKDVGAKLTDAQKATITAKNWTLVY